MASRPRTRDFKASSSAAAATSVGVESADAGAGVDRVGSLLSFRGLRFVLLVAVSVVASVVAGLVVVVAVVVVSFDFVSFPSTTPPAEPALPTLASLSCFVAAAFRDLAAFVAVAAVTLGPGDDDFEAMVESP